MSQGTGAGGKHLTINLACHGDVSPKDAQRAVLYALVLFQSFLRPAAPRAQVAPKFENRVLLRISGVLCRDPRKNRITGNYTLQSIRYDFLPFYWIADHKILPRLPMGFRIRQFREGVACEISEIAEVLEDQLGPWLSLPSRFCLKHSEELRRGGGKYATKILEPIGHEDGLDRRLHQHRPDLQVGHVGSLLVNLRTCNPTQGTVVGCLQHLNGRLLLLVPYVHLVEESGP